MSAVTDGDSQRGRRAARTHDDSGAARAARPSRAPRPPRASREPRTGWRAVAHALALGLTTGLLVIVAGLAVVLIVVPKATGSTPLTVLTQSMDPTLPPGTLLVVRPTQADDIRIGDVVTYQITSGQPAVISHRVTAVQSSSDGSRTFTLKGDNNALADPAPVTAAQVRGVVWYSLPDVGLVNQLVNGSRSWLVPAIAGVLLAYGAVMIAIGTVSSARRRRTRRHSDAAGGPAHRSHRA